MEQRGRKAPMQSKKHRKRTNNLDCKYESIDLPFSNLYVVVGLRAALQTLLSKSEKIFTEQYYSKLYQRYITSAFVEISLKTTPMHCLIQCTIH